MEVSLILNNAMVSSSRSDRKKSFYIPTKRPNALSGAEIIKSITAAIIKEKSELI